MAFTPITNNLDWAAVSFINEFNGALDERKKAVDLGTQANTSIGTDVQAKSFWRTYQEWTFQQAANWIQSHDTSGSPRAAEYYDGKDAIDLWTCDTFMESISGGSAGAGQKHFRRATTMPANWSSWTDSAYSYGYMQSGDIIGPWIFKDLQEAFRRLIWTRGGAYWTQPSEYKGHGEDNWYPYEWSVAKSAAEANWHEVSTNPSGMPGTHSSTYEHTLYGYKRADLRRRCPKAWTIIPTSADGITRDVEWYAKTINWSGGTFFAHGDGVGEGKFKLWLTEPGLTQGGNPITSTSGWMESRKTIKPTWPPSDPSLYGYHIESNGWPDSATIIRWTGFDYK